MQKGHSDFAGDGVPDGPPNGRAQRPSPAFVPCISNKATGIRWIPVDKILFNYCGVTPVIL